MKLNSIKLNSIKLNSIKLNKDKKTLLLYVVCAVVLICLCVILYYYLCKKNNVEGFGILQGTPLRTSYMSDNLGTQSNGFQLEVIFNYTTATNNLILNIMNGPNRNNNFGNYNYPLLEILKENDKDNLIMSCLATNNTINTIKINDILPNTNYYCLLTVLKEYLRLDITNGDKKFTADKRLTINTPFNNDKTINSKFPPNNLFIGIGNPGRLYNNNKDIFRGQISTLFFYSGDKNININNDDQQTDIYKTFIKYYTTKDIQNLNFNKDNNGKYTNYGTGGHYVKIINDTKPLNLFAVFIYGADGKVINNNTDNTDNTNNNGKASMSSFYNLGKLEFRENNAIKYVNVNKTRTLEQTNKKLNIDTYWSTLYNNQPNYLNCSATDNPGENWWLYTFKTSTVITGIEIYSRSDCCADRISNVKVEILDILGNKLWSNQVPEVFLTNNNWHVFYVPMQVITTTTPTTTTTPITTNATNATNATNMTTATTTVANATTTTIPTPTPRRTIQINNDYDYRFYGIAANKVKIINNKTTLQLFGVFIYGADGKVLNYNANAWSEADMALPPTLNVVNTAANALQQVYYPSTNWKRTLKDTNVKLATTDLKTDITKTNLYSEASWWQYTFKSPKIITGIEIYSSLNAAKISDVIVELLDSNNNILWSGKTPTTTDNNNNWFVFYIDNPNPITTQPTMPAPTNATPTNATPTTATPTTATPTMPVPTMPVPTMPAPTMPVPTMPVPTMLALTTTTTMPVLTTTTTMPALTTTTTMPLLTTTRATITTMPALIADSIKNGDTVLNSKRFDTMNNQMRLDALNERVNSLLRNIDYVFSLEDKPNIKPITFY